MTLKHSSQNTAISEEERGGEKVVSCKLERPPQHAKTVMEHTHGQKIGGEHLPYLLAYHKRCLSLFCSLSTSFANTTNTCALRNFKVCLQIIVKRKRFINFFFLFQANTNMSPVDKVRDNLI